MVNNTNRHTSILWELGLCQERPSPEHHACEAECSIDLSAVAESIALGPAKRRGQTHRMASAHTCELSDWRVTDSAGKCLVTSAQTIMLSDVVAGLQNVSWKLQMARKQWKLSLVVSEALIHHELVVT